MKQRTMPGLIIDFASVWDGLIIEFLSVRAGVECVFMGAIGYNVPMIMFIHALTTIIFNDALDYDQGCY